MPTLSVCALSALDFEINISGDCIKKERQSPLLLQKTLADLPDDNLDHIVIKAGLALAELHHLKDWHGRPVIRDTL